MRYARFLLVSLGLASACLGASCREVLESFWSTFPRNFGTWSLERSVKVVPNSSIPGHYGGRRFLLERVGDTWGSKFYDAPNAIQGDPQRILGFLGAEPAAFLGFERVDHVRMYVPDEREYSGALALLNRALLAQGHEPVHLGYYEVLSETGPTRYIREFATSRRLPLAREGNSAVHDRTFHVPSILIPNAVIDHLQRQTQIVEEFAKFLEQVSTGTHPNPASLKPQDLQWAAHAVRMAQLVHLDTFTANVATATEMFYHYGESSMERVHEVLGKELMVSYGGGVPPPDYLPHLLELAPSQVTPEMYQSLRRPVRWFGVTLRLPFSALYLKKILKPLPLYLRDFLKLRGEQPGDQIATRMTGQELCVSLQIRRKEIRAALLSLLRTAPSLARPENAPESKN